MAVATDVSGLLDGRLTIGVWDWPDEMVLVVGGDLDLASAPLLVTALAGVLHRRQCARVVLDLEGVGFMDATGLGCIVRAWQSLAVRGGALAVRRPSRSVRRLLELCELGELLR